VRSPFRCARIIPNVLAVAALMLLVLVAVWNAEAAQAKGLAGHCGVHFGALYRIDSGGARYHSRIGPRDGHTGGGMHCHGKVFVHSRGSPASVAGFPGSWDAFNWPHENWHGILALNGTAASSVGFGIALPERRPSGAVDTWLTASAGAG
jgi:hypothetical protein